MVIASNNQHDLFFSEVVRAMHLLLFVDRLCGILSANYLHLVRESTLLSTELYDNLISSFFVVKIIEILELMGIWEVI